MTVRHRRKVGWEKKQMVIKRKGVSRQKKRLRESLDTEAERHGHREQDREAQTKRRSG